MHYLLISLHACLLSLLTFAQEDAGGNDGGFWTQFPLSSLQFPPRNSSSSTENNAMYRYPFTLSIKDGFSEKCIYDSVNIQWNMTAHYEDAQFFDPADCSVAFSLTPDAKDTTPRLVTAASIIQQQQDFSIHKEEVDSGEGSDVASLKCFLDPQHCTIALQEIKIDTNFVDNEGNIVRKILITFSAATNEPELYTAHSINEMFEMNPPLGGEYGAAVGEWLEPDLLRISASDEYIDDLIAASAAGSSVISIRSSKERGIMRERGRDIMKKHDSSDSNSDHSLETVGHDHSAVLETYAGVFNLRFPRQGQYKLFVIHSTTKKILSSVHKVKIQLCGDNVIPSDLPLQTRLDDDDDNSEGKEEKQPPRPLVRHAGVLAISGHHSVVIPHSALPPLHSNGGSFSVSFWFRLLDSAAGNFRAFFYKGDGIDPNRTPSAWLIPTSNRLAIRATTEERPDLGADSSFSIPLNQWTHVCFVFDNRTQPANGGGYKIVAYIDGQLDISIGYSTEVMPNNASFQMFKDVSHDGPRAFVADLVVWDSPLTASQVRNIASASATSSFRRWTQPVDLALDLMEGISDSAAGGDEDDLSEDQKKMEEGSEEEAEAEEALLYSENLRQDFDLLLASLPVPSTSPASSVPLDSLLKDIASAMESCSAPSIRLDLYAEASSLGHLESLYHWAMLIAFGSEKSVSKCGIEVFDGGNSMHVRYNNDVHPMDVVFDRVNERHMKERRDWRGLDSLPVSDQVKAAVALIVAAQAGYTAAFVPLSTLMSTGIGLVPLLNDLQDTNYAGKKSRHILAHICGYIPLPVDLSISLPAFPDCAEVKSLTCLSPKFQQGIIIDSGALLFYPLPLLYRLSQVLRQSAGLVSPSSAEMTTQLGIASSSFNKNKNSAKKKLYSHGVGTGAAVNEDIFYQKKVEGYDLPLSDSVFSWNTHFSKTSKNDQSHLNLVTKLTSGLLLLAALDDHPDAIIALQKRYQHGLGGVEVSLEVSAFYSKIAALTAATEYFKVGGQPVMENDRINDDTELTVLQGNTGKDDDVVQTYMVQASEGDVGSMLALGEMNYYGTRGIPRNQPRALEYYNQAAALGNVGGMCGAAGMYVKGEGTEKNVSQAVSLYETAASLGSVRALNGLGFFYFFGDGDTPANHTKALNSFLTATEQQDGDSDSWFNAGYCIEHGLGCEADAARAAVYYKHAATKFGHFGSIVAMGNMHYEGKGVSRSVKESVYYLGVANDVGPWMGWLRRGFDQFVQGGKRGLLSFDTDSKHFMRSALCYIHAGELGGFEVSQSNAAYLLQRKLFTQKTKQLYLGSNLLEGAVPSKQLLLDSPIDQKGVGLASSPAAASASVVPAADFADRLLLRELAMSTAQGNANSACSVGTLLLAGHNGDASASASHNELSSAAGGGAGGGGNDDSSGEGRVGVGLGQDLNPEDAFAMVMDTLDKEYSLDKYLPSEYLGDEDSGRLEEATNSDTDTDPEMSTNTNAKAAMAWFSKASAMNSALGSFHSGLMYHFGIGGVEPNLARASRYYSAAISNTANPLHPSLKLMAQMTQWMAEGGGGGGKINLEGEAGGAWSWLSRTTNGVAGWMAKKMLL